MWRCSTAKTATSTSTRQSTVSSFLIALTALSSVLLSNASALLLSARMSTSLWPQLWSESVTASIAQFIRIRISERPSFTVIPGTLPSHRTMQVTQISEICSLKVVSTRRRLIYSRELPLSCRQAWCTCPNNPSLSCSHWTLCASHFLNSLEMMKN
jgi:hypothetical protein